jgi:hypothetical protein
LKKNITMVLLLILLFSLASCVSSGIDSRYAVNIEETKKNIVDNRQKSIFNMIKSNISMLEFEIKGDQIIWYVDGVAMEDVSTIKNISDGVLIIVDKNNDQQMELKYDGDKIFMFDPVMGIYIVFTKNRKIK